MANIGDCVATKGKGDVVGFASADFGVLVGICWFGASVSLACAGAPVDIVVVIGFSAGDAVSGYPGTLLLVGEYVGDCRSPGA